MEHQIGWYNKNKIFKGPVVAQGAKCDCKNDWSWFRSPLEEMKYLLKIIFPFLRSGVEARCRVELFHSTRKPPEFGKKWRTECPNTRLPLPTLLCAEHSVKLIFNYIYIIVHLSLFKNPLVKIDNVSSFYKMKIIEICKQTRDMRVTTWTYKQEPKLPDITNIAHVRTSILRLVGTGVWYRTAWICLFIIIHTLFVCFLWKLILIS